MSVVVISLWAILFVAITCLLLIGTIMARRRKNGFFVVVTVVALAFLGAMVLWLSQGIWGVFLGDLTHPYAPVALGLAAILLVLWHSRRPVLAVARNHVGAGHIVTPKRTLLTLLSLVVIAVGTGAFLAWDSGRIRIDSSGLRTYNVREGGFCNASNRLDWVSGVLEGDPTMKDPIWLNDDGREIHVIWPEGFTVVFNPDAVLYGRQGQIIAREGQGVVLRQTDPRSHTGTYEDPYFGTSVSNGCYPRG